MSFLGRRKKIEGARRVLDPAEIEYPFPAKLSSRGISVPPVVDEEHIEQPVYVPPVIHKPATIKDVTAVIVNFKTLKLTRDAWQSLSDRYDMKIILVDNASGDGSTSFVQKKGGILNPTNIGHGPALHKAIQTVTTRYVLALDSDCVVEKSGWIEQMLEKFSDPLTYAVGWRRWVDRLTGVPIEWHLEKRPPDRYVAYGHPACSIYDVAKYRTLVPFFHHGAPCLQNMVDAESHGYKVVPFPVFQYVKHLIAGTRRMYNGRWDPKTEEKPNKWKDGGVWPI